MSEKSNVWQSNKLGGLKYGLLFLVVILIVAGLPLCGLQYYDSGSDSTFATIFKGAFTDAPGRQSNNHGNLTVITNIYQQLYIWQNNVDWYGGSMVLFMACAIFLLLRAISVVLQLSNTRTGFYVTGLALFAILVLFIENVIIVEFTRVAFMLAFAGLFTIWVQLLQLKAGNEAGRLWFVLGTVAFITGGFVRNQPAYLCFIMMVGLFFMSVLKGRIKFNEVAKKLAIPLLFIIALIINSGIRWDKDIDKTPDLGGYLISLWDVHYLKNDIKLTNAADSITYKLITQYHYMGDPAQINEAFFKRIGTPYTVNQVHSLPAMIANNLQYKTKFNDVTVYNLKRHAGWVYLCLFCFLIAFIAQLQQIVKARIILVAMLVLFAVMYVLISMLLKMEERIFDPLFFVFSVIFILSIDTDWPTTISRKSILLVLLLGVIWGMALELPGLYQRFSVRKNESEYVSNAINFFETRNEKYVFIDNLIYRVYAHPLQAWPLPAGKVYPSLDNHGYFLDPTYARKMFKITGGRNVNEYARFIASHSNSCLIVSDRPKMDELVHYFDAVYGLKLKVNPVVNDFRDTYKIHPEMLGALGIYQLTYADSSITDN